MVFMFNEHSPKKILFNGHNVSKLIFNGNLVFGGESGITINCFDVETELLLQTIKLETPADGILYFNNDNAPIVDGYDFVVMDGIKHIGVVDDDSFNVWYVSNTVFNRIKTSWSAYYENDTREELPIINTFNATDLYHLHKNCQSVRRIRRFNTSKAKGWVGAFEMCYALEELPDLDYSNATTLSYLCHQSRGIKYIPDMLTTGKVASFGASFNGCRSLVKAPRIDTSSANDINGMFANCPSMTEVPYMDTSKVKNMKQLFLNDSKLTTISWEIDMSSCTNCTQMFTGCPAKNIKLKNVPTSLDLSQIGTKNYTVVNYI